jgi:hypothetical protein
LYPDGERIAERNVVVNRLTAGGRRGKRDGRTETERQAERGEGWQKTSHRIHSFLVGEYATFGLVIAPPAAR